MLHKNHISNIQIGSEEWHLARLGKITSSKVYNLCSTKEELTTGALTYIYYKAGEKISGHLSEDEILEDENIAWGNIYEVPATQLFGQKMGVKFLVVQKLIIRDENFSSTPDAIWIKGVCENQDEYNVRTVEVKCPKKFHRFIPLYLTKTPADVKKVDPKYFWQVIDQMENCGSAIGYFVAYHPLFPEGKNMNIVEFNKMDLWEDFKFLQRRKAAAVEKIKEIQLSFLAK
jgi:hypothetical protein